MRECYTTETLIWQRRLSFWGQESSVELIPGNVLDHTAIAEGSQDLHLRVSYNLRAPSFSVLALHFSDRLFLSSKFTSYSAFLHARLHSNTKSGTNISVCRDGQESDALGLLLAF